MVFASILSSWSKSNNPNAIQNAETVIEWMKQMHVPFNTLVYNTLISVWGNSKHPGALVKTLEYFVEMKGKESCFPDLITNMAVLKGLFSSKVTKAAITKVYEVLGDM